MRALHCRRIGPHYCVSVGGEESKALFSFLWFRDHRRYFYVNEHSGESQWEFPDGEEEEEGQILENKAEALPKQALKEKIESGEESTDNATGTGLKVLLKEN